MKYTVENYQYNEFDKNEEAMDYINQKPIDLKFISQLKDQIKNGTISLYALLQLTKNDDSKMLNAYSWLNENGYEINATNVSMASEVEGYNHVYSRVNQSEPLAEPLDKNVQLELFRKMSELKNLDDDINKKEYNKIRDELIVRNLKLAKWMATTYYAFRDLNIEQEDLFSLCKVSLIRSVDRFDVNMGAAFSTYAITSIRNDVLRQYSKENAITSSNYAFLNKIKLEKEKYFSLNNEYPSDKYLQEFLGVSDKTYNTIKQQINFSDEKNYNSIEAIGEEVNYQKNDELYEDIDIHDEVSYKMLKEILSNVLSTLTPREENVLIMRFGLDDGRMKTLEEVGAFYQVTREKIRQIEAKALRKLRHPSRAKKVKDYIK